MIGYRISAGSPIGRSPRTVAAPARQLRLICYVKTSIASIPSLVPPSAARPLSQSPSTPPYSARSLATHLAWPPLRRSSTYRHRPQTGSARDRGRNGIERKRRRGKTLFFFIGAVRRCLLIRLGANALSKKWPVDGTTFLFVSNQDFALGAFPRPNRFVDRFNHRLSLNEN